MPNQSKLNSNQNRSEEGNVDVYRFVFSRWGAKLCLVARVNLGGITLHEGLPESLEVFEILTFSF